MWKSSCHSVTKTVIFCLGWIDGNICMKASYSMTSDEFVAASPLSKRYLVSPIKTGEGTVWWIGLESWSGSVLSLSLPSRC